jgi:hypothetical protein
MSFPLQLIASTLPQYRPAGKVKEHGEQKKNNNFCQGYKTYRQGSTTNVSKAFE